MTDIADDLPAVLREAATAAIAHVDAGRLSNRLIVHARANGTQSKDRSPRVQWYFSALVAAAVVVIALVAATVTGVVNLGQHHRATQPAAPVSSASGPILGPSVSPSSTPTFTPSPTGSVAPSGSTSDSGTPAGPRSNCLTSSEALALVQALEDPAAAADKIAPPTLTLDSAPLKGYLCDGSWAVVNFHYPAPNANHATVDLHYLGGRWVLGDRTIACGTTAQAMPASLQEWGCGN